MRWGKIALAAGTALVTLLLGVRVFRAVEWRARARRIHHPPALRELRALDEAFARDHWAPLKGSFCTDPVALLVRKPDVEETWPWKEYPGQRLRMRTNEQGFREDVATPTVFDGPRVLVSGDSHTDGMVENALSFANVAERELTTRLGRAVDVVNAGVGFTSPRCYLGMLRKCLPLHPDVFVAVVFTGNDFTDELALCYDLGERPTPPPPEGHMERALAVAAGTLPFFQGMNQAYRFAKYEGESELALSLALRSLTEIQELCRANGIEFLLVLLPTKVDVDDDGREEWAAACARLGIEVSTTAENLALGRRLLASAREQGIDCFDPCDAMRAEEAPLYWSEDHHLGLAGHACLGRLLAERLAGILARHTAASAATDALER